METVEACYVIVDVEQQAREGIKDALLMVSLSERKGKRIEEDNNVVLLKSAVRSSVKL